MEQSYLNYHGWSQWIIKWKSQWFAADGEFSLVEKGTFAVCRILLRFLILSSSLGVISKSCGSFCSWFKRSSDKENRDRNRNPSGLRISPAVFSIGLHLSGLYSFFLTRIGSCTFHVRSPAAAYALVWFSQLEAVWDSCTAERRNQCNLFLFLGLCLQSWPCFWF